LRNRLFEVAGDTQVACPEFFEINSYNMHEALGMGVFAFQGSASRLHYYVDYRSFVLLFNLELMLIIIIDT